MTELQRPLPPENRYFSGHRSIYMGLCCRDCGFLKPDPAWVTRFRMWWHGKSICKCEEHKSRYALFRELERVELAKRP